MPAPVRSRRALPFGAVLLAVASFSAVPVASAQPVRRVAEPLAAQPSSFVPVAGPQTTLRTVPGEGGGLQARSAEGALRRAGPDTTFGAVQGPQTDLRLSEVPAALRTRTRELLTELRARETPSHAIVVDLPADVLFDFDRADLRPDARAALGRAGELLRAYPRAPIAIDGHTDGKGADSYNDALSLRRAQAVAAALADATGERRPTVRGHGRHQPVAAERRPDGSDDADGRQRNRRVSIVIEPLPNG
ncbi:OmpA family protein [uncultured Xylophilus sp.]|uniref:OmpA family protein n=1 Tax=uncultured Xylophilus sp. TaxID=296832 RepID=UPI0025E67FD7|nr:OmpA family protein [uncultured Xylophilus sp.]